ncbi:hypothetical protein WR25_08370 [Diploscapter pachys]|uniref:Apple domain-containing protein n=1 Tax=Diploscapter pachys TaxID=2018661 RepID=A0A2A2L2E8_9BILA|nr:hypothetical protein WR25_08370 [Diploscapter pachys]
MIPNRLSEASAEPSAFPLAAAALPSTSSPLLPTLLPLPLLLNLTNSASAFDPTTLYLQSLLLGEFIKQQTENCNVILNTLQAKSMVSSPSTSVQPSPTEIPKNSPSFPRKAEKSKTDKAKNYPCIICVVCKEKICARSRRLHIEAHFSYQPHSCSVCGFAARKSIIVQLHVNKMHRGNGQVITKVDEKIEAEDNEGRAERAAMARSSSLLGDFRVQKKVNENGEREREDSLIKHTRADSDTDVTGNLIGRDDSRLVVAGIPDMSDPCFRRYANCIIVNAQPYERRSTTGLITCKAHCLQSQSSAYNCRSFIYDNINQVAQLPD